MTMRVAYGGRWNRMHREGDDRQESSISVPQTNNLYNIWNLSLLCCTSGSRPRTGRHQFNTSDSRAAMLGVTLAVATLVYPLTL